MRLSDFINGFVVSMCLLIMLGLIGGIISVFLHWAFVHFGITAAVLAFFLTFATFCGLMHANDKRFERNAV